MVFYPYWQQALADELARNDTGNWAQWASVVCTLLAVLVALFKDSIFKWWYKPKLEVRILQSGPDSSIASINEKYGIYCRLFITNKGRATANSTCVYLTDLQQYESDSGIYKSINGFSPIPLLWTVEGADTKVNIYRCVGLHCNLFHIHPSASAMLHGDSVGGHGNQEIILDVKENVARGCKILRPGTYLMNVLVTAENVKAKQYRIKVTYDGGWSSDIQNLFAEHLTISSPVEV